MIIKSSDIQNKIRLIRLRKRSRPSKISH
uniref:Uncharacterized protein n=1 Tax=Rhizophora mucronata TaxID=61149 RepID=A0A2P2PHU2_RHIMU